MKDKAAGMLGKAGALALVSAGSLFDFSRRDIHISGAAGPLEVGTWQIVLRDRSRPDPFDPKSGPRRIPVRFWYPAQPSDTAGQLRFCGDRSVPRLLAKSLGAPGFLFRKLMRVVTDARVSAPFAQSVPASDVLFFSHGYGANEMQSFPLMERLASHGYVAASVCHTGEAFAAVLADGEIVPFSKKERDAFLIAQTERIREYDRRFREEIGIRYLVGPDPTVQAALDIRMDDLRFAADSLKEIHEGNIVSPLHGKLRTGRYGVFGHSFGGALAGAAVLTDDRFSCFVNIDGAPHGRSSQEPVEKPFLVIRSDRPYDIENAYYPGEVNFDIAVIANTQHLDFTALNLVMPELKKLGAFGAADPVRVHEITGELCRAFFDSNLHGAPDRMQELATLCGEMRLERR